MFTELEAVAKIQSVKSSNEIEGIVTSDERIWAIVNQESKPLNHTEGEIAGYRDALNLIHLHHDKLDFRQSDILKLHETIMKFTDYEYGGKYKVSDNYIIEQDKDGNRRIRFKPTPASEVDHAMEQLELAYLEASSNANINKLLLIPCVILDFLCIHPFRDGNGRMSRLLTLLLLYKNDYDVGNHTISHINIGESSSDLIQKEIGGLYNKLEEITDDYVKIIALPFGSPYNRDDSTYQYVLNGTYNGKSYETEAALRVGWEPEVSPYDKSFDKTYMKRCRAYDNNGKDFDIEMVFNNLKNNRYISDGNAKTIVTSKDNESKINDIDKEIIIY